jgi:hypothetical protein
MSVDALVNDVELIAVEDELSDIVEEFKNSPDRYMPYQYVAALLLESYKALYTKTPLLIHIMSLLGASRSCALGLLIRIVFQYLSTAIALALFAATEKKRHYSQADIIMSYVLLVGAIVLDLLPAFTSTLSYVRKPFQPGTTTDWACLCLSNCIFCPIGWQTTKQWSEELAQYSMIRRHCSTSNAWIPSLGKWIAKCFGAWCVEFFDTTRTPVTNDLKLLVLDKLLLQTTKREWDIASFRGERALEKWMDIHQAPELGRSGYVALHMSLNSSSVDFPRSVLVWHIATDICYFSVDKGRGAESDEAKNMMVKKKMTSRELSLYIMYLVFKCDVMLTSISRLAHEGAHRRLAQFIFDAEEKEVAMDVFEGHLEEKEAIMEVFEALKKEERQQGSMPDVSYHDKNEEPANNDDATTTSRFQELLQSTEEALYYPVLSRAHAVAQELMSINDEAARWDLISEVWLEMLFYTAPRCGAAFHYEHLSTGGEFISHVLLLMHHLGPFMPKPAV